MYIGKEGGKLPLSDREKEILRMVALGKTGQVAAPLWISKGRKLWFIPSLGAWNHSIPTKISYGGNP